jgi:hypothetical protein
MVAITEIGFQADLTELMSKTSGKASEIEQKRIEKGEGNRV